MTEALSAKQMRDKAQLRYRPEKIEWLLIAEAPPMKEGRFFYFEHVKAQDSLFLETMHALYYREGFRNRGMRPKKAEWLERFKKDGFFLIDSLNEPIDASDEVIQAKILAEKEDLLARIECLGLTRETKILLISKNAFVLRDFLITKGFKKVNSGKIDFPGSGWQIVSRKQIRTALREYGYGGSAEWREGIDYNAIKTEMKH